MPCYMLFINGKAKSRLPPKKEDGTVVNTLIDREGMLAFFDIDGYLIKSKQAEYRDTLQKKKE